MNIKKSYYYLFYKLYKVALTGAIKSLSKFYAELGILMIEIFFAFSLYNYYAFFFNKNAYVTFELKSFKVIFSLITIAVIYYFAFYYNDKWKDYVSEFEKWPKNKNILGGIIVCIIILFIIGNFIYSEYLLGFLN